jgi:hypothetical protein
VTSTGQSERDAGDGARSPGARYFTDGVNLFRFVGWLSRTLEEKLAELEDCRSLDILLVTASELDGSALRQVR